MLQVIKPQVIQGLLSSLA